MACGSCGGTWTTNAPGTAQVGGKVLYQVVTDGGEGRVAYQSHKLDLVREVHARYPGSAIVPDPDEQPVTAVTQVSESDTAEAESVTRPEPTTSKRSRKSSDS